MAHFEHSSVISFPRKDVFEFTMELSNLPLIMSDYKVDFTTPISRLKKGSEYEIRITRYGISVLWGIYIEEVIPNEMIRDRQTHGPFSLWVHTHKFEDHGDGTLLKELIEYDVPFGLLGKLADDLLMKKELQRVFESRHRRISELLGKN